MFSQAGQTGVHLLKGTFVQHISMPSNPGVRVLVVRACFPKLVRVKDNDWHTFMLSVDIIALS
jgi:hypothetical protein